MAKGFTDSNGKFRPTGTGKGISNREKALRTAGIPIDDFDTSFLRTTEGDRLLAERVERQRLKKIEDEKEQRRVERLEGKIRELEQEFGDQLILGVDKQLNDKEWVELNNLLVDEVEAEFDPKIKVKERRIEDLLVRLTFNDADALRSIQGDGGLRKMTIEDHKRNQQRWKDELNKGEFNLEGEPTPHLSLQMFKDLPHDQKLLGDDGVITTKFEVSDILGFTQDEVEEFEDSSGKNFQDLAEDSVFFYRPYFGDLDTGDKVIG